MGISRVAAAQASRDAVDFEEWVAPHLPTMARLAVRLVPRSDRDDVLQESLAAAWRKRSTFDAARGTPQAWLLAIVADQCRKNARRRRHVPLVGEIGAYTDRPGDIDVERAVMTLPAPQRLAVELHYFLDLPVAEVAAAMGCSPGIVKATLSHARARLERELGTEHR